MLKMCLTGAARRVADDNETVFKKTETYDSFFTAVLARVFDLDRQSLKDKDRVLEIEPTIFERSLAFGGVVGDAQAKYCIYINGTIQL